MPYLINIDSFSKAPLDSYPPNLSMSKSIPMPSISMNVHSLLQKQAYESMTCNEVDCLSHHNVLCWCNVKEEKSFIGLLNNYKAMIPHCSYLLTPLTALTKKSVQLDNRTSTSL
jgi:hypothetical protein